MPNKRKKVLEEIDIVSDWEDALHSERSSLMQQLSEEEEETTANSAMNTAPTTNTQSKKNRQGKPPLRKKKPAKANRKPKITKRKMKLPRPKKKVNDKIEMAKPRIPGPALKPKQRAKLERHCGMCKMKF